MGICLIEPDWETNTINIATKRLVRKIIIANPNNF